jgi:hypothetical protein
VILRAFHLVQGVLFHLLQHTFNEVGALYQEHGPVILIGIDDRPVLVQQPVDPFGQHIS